MRYKYWKESSRNTNLLDLYHDENLRKETSSVSCDCGSDSFKVNAVPAPYTGGFVKITCVKCGKGDVLMDDFS